MHPTCPLSMRKVGILYSISIFQNPKMNTNLLLKQSCIEGNNLEGCYKEAVLGVYVGLTRGSYRILSLGRGKSKVLALMWRVCSRWVWGHAP